MKRYFLSFLCLLTTLVADPIELASDVPFAFSPARAHSVVLGRDNSPRRFLSARIFEPNRTVSWSGSPGITSATIFINGPAVHPAAGGGGPTYLIKQDFEGTGYDNSETWTETGTGTKDEDYTTSPAPLEGSQSLHIAGTAQTPMVTSPTFTAQSDLWVYFLVNLTVPGSQQTLFQLRTSSTQLVQIAITSAGLLRASNGGTAANTVSALSSATTYHVWIHYTKGTGANGVTTAAFSTNGIKPTSGNAFVSVTTGNATADCDRVVVGVNASTTFDYIVDKIRVDDATIGDNPS